MSLADVPPEFAAIKVKADHGDQEAQYEMGWRYALGRGLPENDEEAVRWLRKAAENGHLLAQNNLGARFYSGEGVARDLVEAYKWFELAARQGDRKAAKNRDTIASQLSLEERAAGDQRIEQFQKDHGQI